MKYLGLDISTKTGWAYFEDKNLKEFGLISLDKKVKDFDNYPFNYMYFTKAIVDKILDLIFKIMPDIIIIEQTNKAKSRWSQKLLEFIHCQLLLTLKDYKFKVIYLSTSAWKKALEIRMSNADKKNNKLVNKAKKEGKSKKELGVKGKITSKHLSVAYVNQVYGLKLKIKDNNEADAVALVASYLNGAQICTGE